MRAAVAIAALSLAACHVNVEGAPCSVPGTTTECPSGQACGNDGKCSERAAACVGAQTFCRPGVTPKRCRASPAAIETCIGDDICGTWAALNGDTCTTGLVCALPGGVPSCACAAVSEILVDQSAPSGSLAPTGAPQPAECRFKKLGDALAYAATFPPPVPAEITVRALGTPTPGAPIQFAAESFPLVVPHGVTLATSAAQPNPSDWVISATAGPHNMIELHDGAVIDGFTLHGAPATGNGIVVVCGSTAPATARNIVLDGGNTLDRGVVVTGTCGVTATQLDVSAMTKSGLYVNTGSPVGLTVTGGSLRNNIQSGAEVVAGELSISGAAARFDISGNGQHGVRAATDQVGPQPIALSLTYVDVHENGEVGVLAKDLTSTSSASIASSLLRKNLASSSLSQYGTGRSAGGLLVWGNLPMTQAAPPVPAFAFKGNTVCSNAGDEIGVFSNDPWPLSGDFCDPTSSNVFVNPGASSYYIYSTSTGDDVPATSNWWSPNPPTGFIVKAAIVPSCGPVTVTPPECN